MFTTPIAFFSNEGSGSGGIGLNYCQISDDVLNSMKFTLSTIDLEFCTLSSNTLRTLDWVLPVENVEYCAISQVGNGFENQIAQPVLSNYCPSNFVLESRTRPPGNLNIDYIANYCPRDFLNMVRVRPPINLNPDYISNYCPRDFTGMERGTPSNMIYYLDASDTSTITHSSNQVSEWRNKARTVHLNQVDSSRRPLTNTNTINGLNVIKFNGINGAGSWLRGDWGTLFSDFDNYTIAVIVHFTDSSTRQILFRQDNGSGDFGCDFIDVTPTTNGNFYSVNVDPANRVNYLNYAGSFSSEYIADSFPNMSILQKNNTTVSVRTNGSLKASGTSNTNYLYTSSDNYFLTLGKNGPHDSIPFAGNYCEFLVWKEALNQTRLEQLEGYAAHKWGFTSKLPTNHPYKTTNPNINPLYL